MTDIGEHYRDQTKPYPAGNNPVLANVTKYLEACGMNDPLTKIYITSEPLDSFPVFLFALVLEHLPHLTYDPNFGSLVKRKSHYHLDGAPLLVGLVTILKQLHPSYTTQFLVRFRWRLAAAARPPRTAHRHCHASS